MRRLTPLAVAAFLALLLGCPKPSSGDDDGDGNGSDAGGGPRVVIFPHSQAQGESVPCTEGFCKNGPDSNPMVLVYNEAGLNLKIEAPEGTIVNIAGEPIVVHKSPQDGTINLKSKLADYPIAQPFLRLDAHARSKMGPGAKLMASSIVLDLGFLHLQMLKLRDKAASAEDGGLGDAGAADAGHHKGGRGEKAGVLFEGESASTANARKLVYFVGRTPGPGKLVGASVAARWRDIDYVAYEKPKFGTGEICPDPFGGDAGSPGLKNGASHIVPHVRTLHSDVTLYDRRTGKLVDQNAFDAKTACPDAAAAGELRVLLPDPSNDGAIESWLKSKLAN